MIYYGDQPAYRITSFIRNKGYLYEKTAIRKMNEGIKILVRFPWCDIKKFHVVPFVPEIPVKSTGIIRRIDDLGRVVIPKEIRRIINLSEGDPLELVVDENKIILRKYEGEAKGQ